MKSKDIGLEVEMHCDGALVIDKPREWFLLRNHQDGYSLTTDNADYYFDELKLAIDFIQTELGHKW